MKLLCTLVCLSALALVSTAKADTILVQNTNNNVGGKAFYGQSFTTPDDGTTDTLTGFNWMLSSTSPTGTGNLYIFDQAYTGTVADLSTGDGLLGEAAWNATTKEFDFSLDAITLDPNTMYYVYSDTQVLARRIANGTDVYTGGDEYTVGGDNNFAAQPNQDMAFQVFTINPTPAPEPSTVALAGFAIFAVFGARKFPILKKAMAHR